MPGIWPGRKAFSTKNHCQPPSNVCPTFARHLRTFCQAFLSQNNKNSYENIYSTSTHWITKASRRKLTHSVCPTHHKKAFMKNSEHFSTNDITCWSHQTHWPIVSAQLLYFEQVENVELNDIEKLWKYLRFIAVGNQVSRAPSIRANPRKYSGRIIASNSSHYLAHFLIGSEYDGSWKESVNR